MISAEEEQQFADWISVAEEPSQPGLIFLGSAEQRITLYSQQIRALRTVHALKATRRLEDRTRVAVVGGGAAGATAAICLAIIGHRVELIEMAPEIMHLQSSSDRQLHPHIYDWPRPGSLQQQAGLPILEWVEATGGNVRNAVHTVFSSIEASHPNLTFRKSTAVTGLSPSGGAWELSFGDKTEEFDLVFLTLGFGDEKTAPGAPLHDYWKSNGAYGAALDTGSKRYFISGTGDGALADAIAANFTGFKQVEFVEWFLNLFSGPNLADAVSIIYADTPNDEDLEPAFREKLLPIFSARGVIQALRDKLRLDREITINTSGPLFQKGRAAPLNQVIMFAVVAACLEADKPVLRSTGQVSSVTAVGSDYIVNGPDFGDVAKPFSQVILRHGPDRGKRYDFCATQYQKYTSYLAGLKTTHPERFEPPELAPSSHKFFTAAYRDGLKDPTQIEALDAIIIRREQTIIVGWDNAIQRPTQQGFRRIEDICQDCDTVSGPIVIHFAVQRSRIKAFAEEVERFARASNGRILFEAAPSVHASWTGHGVTVGNQSGFVSPYNINDLPSADTLRSKFDVHLVKRLGEAVSLGAGGDCGIFTNVHPTVSATFAATWDGWRKALLDDPELCASFLRILAGAVDSGAGWDGDSARFNALAGGVVLLLATHAGRPATPIHSPHGNVSFSDAIGIASGSEWLNGERISDTPTDHFHSADALILSGAQEELRSGRDFITDGGDPTRTFLSSERVRPAIVQNTRRWRTALQGDLKSWIAAIENEFAEWKARQDAQLES